MTMTDRQLRSCLLHDTNSTSTRKAHYNISRYELQEEILYSCDRLPLHRACASKPPVEVVKALLDIYPEAIKYREKYGATVLHISVQNKASSHVVSFLIQRWKMAASEKDSFGLIPLHLAGVYDNVTEGSSHGVLFFLLQVFPEGVSIRDGKGDDGYTPIDYARESTHPHRDFMIKEMTRPIGYWKAITLIGDEEEASLHKFLANEDWEKSLLILMEDPDLARMWSVDSYTGLSYLLTSRKNETALCDGIYSDAHDGIFVAYSSVQQAIPVLPIHIACNRFAPIQVISKLLKGATVLPQAGLHDVTPLHIAVSHGNVDVDVVNMLLKVHSMAARLEDVFGLLPIHVAVISGACVHVVKSLLVVFPACISVKCGDGKTPFEHAIDSVHPNKNDIMECLNKHSDILVPLRNDQEDEYDCRNERPNILKMIERSEWESIHSRLVSNPDEACILIEGGNIDQHNAKLPIHRACMMKAPSSVISSLINANPSGVCSKTLNNDYPLHLACKYGADVKVIKILFHAYENAIRHRNDFGSTPIHHACMTESSTHILQFMLNAAPDISQIKDNCGLTALDYLEQSFCENKIFLLDTFHRYATSCDNGPSQTLYELIRKKYWKEATARLKKHSNEACTWIIDKNYGIGRLPLHLTCVSQPPSYFIKILISANPAAISTKEKDERLPLHLACQRGASLDVISIILEAHVDAALVKDKFGVLPIHLACAERADYNVIVRLIQEVPESLQLKDNRGWTAMDYCKSVHPEYDSIIKIVQNEEFLIKNNFK